MTRFEPLDMKRLNPSLRGKFTDPTRHFIRAPLAYREAELWVEKDSIRNFFGDLAVKYRLSIQVLRGFASKYGLRLRKRRTRRSETENPT